MGLRVAFVFVAVVAAVAGKTVQLADADDMQVSLRLRGKGAVSIGHGAVSGVSTTLDGADTVATFVLPLTVTDARGTGAGWNVSVTSTAFATTGGYVLADGAATMTAVDESCSGTCTDPANAIAYPLAVPAGATAPAAAVFYDAAAGTGLGAFELDTTLAVAIPGNAYAGKYKSTLTFTAATGP